MTPAVIHIPHSSTWIPEKNLPNYTTPFLEREIRVMTDWYVNRLFFSEHEQLVFPVSRLVCDPERFRNDEDETMSRIGMGAVYTRCSDGSVLRTVTAGKKEKLLRKWYDPHHRKLEKLVRKRLEIFGRCLIVDAHSFHRTPLPYEFSRDPDRPDICLGTDPFHTPPALSSLAESFFLKNGLSVRFNTPYSGTIVPLAFYGKRKEALSIMIEINRGLYLKEDCLPSGDIPSIRRLLSALVTELAEACISLPLEEQISPEGFIKP